ncbi:MAG: peptidase M64 N-terminal domain-containing protein [Bacteroidales bacterium]|nr:peptidase M64 N-terminal domain-containing protein [Bacteroidales bacterium]
MRALLILFGLLATVMIQARNVDFDTCFYEKTLRIDYIHSGTGDTEFYALDELLKEPHWGGSKTN